MQNRIKKADSLKTRTGKLRLGPLSINQLQEQIEKTSKPKMKQRYQKRLSQLQKRGLV